MRDLYKTLELCQTEGVMDYCPEFDGVKSILEYCNKHVKPFKKTCFRSGNDCIVNELTRRLQDYFVERQLVDAETKKPLPDSKQTLRKILVFMLANTDATYKYNIHDDNNIAHVFEICPLMPKFLTISLFWDLQLENLFYEALAYTPCWFSFQFFEAANESLKFIDDAKKLLTMLEEILKALLISLERSSFLIMDTIDQKIILNKMHDQAIILLRRFNTPDANRIERMKKYEQERYWGYKIKHLLQMVVFAFDLYESKLNNEPKIDISIYKIGESFQKMQWTKNQQAEAVKEEQLKIINALLGTLQNCVMSVNMSCFVEWAEVDLMPRLTLQQSIGKLACQVRQRITKNDAFAHGVHAMLSSIEIQPKSIEEILKESTVGKILRALDNDDDDDNDDSTAYPSKKNWFDELFKRGSVVLDNDECLECINDHIELMTPHNCIQIMDFIKLKESMKLDFSDYVNDSAADEDDNTELINLFQNSLKQFTNEDLLLLLDYRFNLFGDYSKAFLQDVLLFEQRLIEFLNKCTTKFNLHEFLLLCFEDPLQVWMKFFITACQIKEHAQHFCVIVQKTLPASFAYVDKVLKQAIFNQTQPMYFSQLLSELYFLLYRADKGDFLGKFLNSHIITLLEAENYESLLSIVNALEMIATYASDPNFDELTAPMLALVSKIAELARWNLATFNNVRVELVTMSINFITETLNRFLPVITEKDRKWLTSKVKTTCAPITQYYFQRLLITSNEDLKSFDSFLLADKDPNGSNIIKFLKKTIIRCTTAEFSELMVNKSFHKHIPNVLLQIANDVNSNTNLNSAQNFRYCFTIYLSFVNCVVDDEYKNWNLLRSLLQLIALSPKDHYEEVFIEGECLLKHLLEICVSKNCNEKELLNLKDFIEGMPDGAAKKIFQQLKEFNIDPN